MPAPKPIPTAGSRQVEKTGKTNKPWSSTLNAPRSAPHAPVQDCVQDWLPTGRDLGSAFGGIPGRLCRLAAVRATGTKGRRRGPTTGPWPLARSPTHAALSLARMAWVAWEGYRFGYGRFLARAWPITQRFPRALRLASLLAGPLAWSAEPLTLSPFPFPRTFDARLGPFATPHTTSRPPSLSWRRPGTVWSGTSKQHHARPAGTWDCGAPAHPARVDRLRCCMQSRLGLLTGRTKVLYPYCCVPVASTHTA